MIKVIRGNIFGGKINFKSFISKSLCKKLKINELQQIENLLTGHYCLSLCLKCFQMWGGLNPPPSAAFPSIGIYGSVHRKFSCRASWISCSKPCCTATKSKYANTPDRWVSYWCHKDNSIIVYLPHIQYLSPWFIFRLSFPAYKFQAVCNLHQTLPFRSSAILFPISGNHSDGHLNQSTLSTLKILLPGNPNAVMSTLNTKK